MKKNNRKPLIKTNRYTKKKTQESEKPRWKKHAELAIGFCGLLLAFVSLGYSVVQFKIQSDFARDTHIAQNKPSFNIEFNSADKNQINGLLLKNVGSGAGEILDFAIYPNRKNYEDKNFKPRK